VNGVRPVHTRGLAADGDVHVAACRPTRTRRKHQTSSPTTDTAPDPGPTSSATRTSASPAAGSAGTAPTPPPPVRSRSERDSRNRGLEEECRLVLNNDIPTITSTMITVITKLPKKRSPASIGVGRSISCVSSTAWAGCLCSTESSMTSKAWAGLADRLAASPSRWRPRRKLISALTPCGPALLPLADAKPATAPGRTGLHLDLVGNTSAQVLIETARVTGGTIPPRPMVIR
jgi:hypothetical protein